MAKLGGLLSNISPQMGFQIGNTALNVGSALFGIGDTSNSTYTQGEAGFNIAQQMQQSSIDTQAQLYEDQAQIALAEGAEAARMKAREGKQAAEQQALTYSGNGVLLAGTPMKVVNDTRIEAKKEVEYITRAAAAQANFLRRQSVVMQNQARATLLAQQMQFNAAKAQAAMTAATTRAGSFQGTLSQIGSLIGTGSAKDPLGTKKPGQTPPPTPPPPAPKPKP